MNPMRAIRVEKVTLNIGVGEPGERLEKAEEVIRRVLALAGIEQKPVRTKAKVRVQRWGIRPGLPIGVKVTVRGKKAYELLKLLFKAVENKISSRSFDPLGNFSFGIREYIDIPGMKYDPAIGIYGMDVTVTLERPGYRVKRRKRKRSKVGKRHLITKDEAIDFVKETFGVEVV
ncbi:MAG: 50S ribosomal protein L5 [Candidatus Diapherotrites archaeon]|nr:50S ribosomal protein L5 [Candidatus Diapherotrites archaeon]